jgi:hypothetical protein
MNLNSNKYSRYYKYVLTSIGMANFHWDIVHMRLWFGAGCWPVLLKMQAWESGQ